MQRAKATASVLLRRRRRAVGGRAPSWSSSSRAVPRDCPASRRSRQPAGPGRPQRRQQRAAHEELTAGRAPSAPAFSQRLRRLELRRARVDPGRDPVVLGRRIGEVGEPVQAQAASDLQRESELLLAVLRRPGPPPLRSSRLHASLAAPRPASKPPNRMERREVPLCVGVGEVRHAVRTHAARKGQRRGERRVDPAEAADVVVACGRRRAELRHVGSRRAAARGDEQRQARQRAQPADGVERRGRCRRSFTPSMVARPDNSLRSRR